MGLLKQSITEDTWRFGRRHHKTGFATEEGITISESQPDILLAVQKQEQVWVGIFFFRGGVISLTIGFQHLLLHEIRMRTFSSDPY